MIPPSKWRWFGHAGHFCASRDCLFHMTTQVGDYLISTVGDYRPRANDTADFVGKAEEIGYGRLYETMVFRAGEPCDVKGCDCGMPQIDGREVDYEPANTAGAAARKHMDMCAKFAAEDDQ